MHDKRAELVVATPPFGACRLAWSDAGLTRVRLLADETADPPQPVPACVGEAAAALQEYFSGRAVDFSSVCLDISALNDFQRAVYAALRRVPYGETTTYGALAPAAGFDAGASRAVGVAMGRNPWPVIVPCHRVMASGGRMGGFSAPGGAATKAKLLQLEGARHAAVAPMLPGLL